MPKDTQPVDAQFEQVDQFTVRIGGREVKFRERLGLKAAPAWPRLLKAVEEDWSNVAKLGTLVIEAWDFDGDPRNARAYDDLDLFTEIPALAYAIGKYLNNRQEAVGLPKG